jgi:hypothetical protein
MHSGAEVAARLADVAKPSATVMRKTAAVLV